jgi:hypothetical protein
VTDVKHALSRVGALAGLLPALGLWVVPAVVLTESTSRFVA